MAMRILAATNIKKWMLKIAFISNVFTSENGGGVGYGIDNRYVAWHVVKGQQTGIFSVIFFNEWFLK